MIRVFLRGLRCGASRASTLMWSPTSSTPGMGRSFADGPGVREARAEGGREAGGAVLTESEDCQRLRHLL